MPEPFILVVEDNSDDVLFLELAFGKIGLGGSVHFVGSGAEAMDYLLGIPPFEDRARYPFPNLFLVDLKMPGMDGFQLLAWLRRPPFMDNRLKVAAMSGSSRQQDFERARGMGAGFCLNKSLDLHEMTDALTEVIQRETNHPLGGQGSPEPAILVAEDDSNDTELLKWAFTTTGLDAPVHFVHNGAEAMDYLVGTPLFDDRTKYPFPKLFIMDLRMPCVDGFELLSWLRRLPGLARLKVAAMSGSSWQQDFERARALGADLCLNKSLDFSELVAAIKNLVAGKN